MKKQMQFGLSTLLIWLTFLSVFFGSLRWIFLSDVLSDPMDVFFAGLLNSPIILLGFIVSPILCVVLLITIIVLLIRSQQATFTSCLFVAYAIALPISLAMTNSTSWGLSFRTLLLMTLSSIACLLEAILRKLPPPQKMVGICAMAITAATYLLLAAAYLITIF